MLSGVLKEVGAANKLWEPADVHAEVERKGQRSLLHFGAVDWHTDRVGERTAGGRAQGRLRSVHARHHRMRRDGATPGREHEIVISVWDPTDEGEQARGKQVRRPRSIWDTAVTGIWQTVWLEPVPPNYVQRLEDPRRMPIATASASKSRPPAAAWSPRPNPSTSSSSGEGGKVAGRREGQACRQASGRAARQRDALVAGEPISLQRRGHAALGGAADRVTSYFGVRAIEMKADERGHQRMFLNGKPLFQYGPLDQGWWPDGLYTAPTDEALKYDLDVTKQLGFNMIRKHVKVEPARWYYWCDKMGILVWQDMPSLFPKAGNDRKNRITAESAQAVRDRDDVDDRRRCRIIRRS